MGESTREQWRKVTAFLLSERVNDHYKNERKRVRLGQGGTT
ncbi:MAG: hypothetical protein R3Y53_11640 [Bacillota bacterium]